jgi:2-dehydro-3-deoxyphosphogluconate aldolase/(4S)-4-hydroxy-2-oxoglutarate aldolase
MGNIWAADKLLGIPLKENLLSEKNKTDYIEHSRHTSQAICEKFPKVKNVANTFRFDKGKDGVSYFATLFNDKNFMVSEEILADGIVDKIGSGDCFMAGLIYGFNNGIELKELLQFSATAAVGKMYESNDATQQSVQQILFNAGIKNGKHEMSRKQQSLEIILNQKVLPLYFHSSREVSINILKALYEAGIRTIEYTNRGKEALENFKALVSFRNSGFNDLQLGIGTIKSASEATAFIKEGADFLISPGFIPEVADAANAAQVLWIPGCMTVSEIIAAEKSGAKLVKIFPGNVLGPSYVSTIKDIFPELKFMPTGGVELNEENINAWFDEGVVAVGLGSKLISKNLCEQENYNEIKVRAAEVLQIVQSIKNKKI